MQCNSVVIAHEGSLIKCTISLSDGRIVSCGNDKLIKVWDGISLKIICELKGHKKKIQAVQEIKKNFLISVENNDNNGEIILWDLNRYQIICRNVCKSGFYCWNGLKYFEKQNILAHCCSIKYSVIFTELKDVHDLHKNKRIKIKSTRNNKSLVNCICSLDNDSFLLGDDFNSLIYITKDNGNYSTEYIKYSEENISLDSNTNRIYVNEIIKIGNKLLDIVDLIGNVTIWKY